jgi:hypothetical protein
MNFDIQSFICQQLNEGVPMVHDKDAAELLFQLEGTSMTLVRELRQREEKEQNHLSWRAKTDDDNTSTSRQREITVSFEALKDIDTDDKPVRRQGEEQEDYLYAILTRVRLGNFRPSISR